jgi:glycerate 2-kinase
MTIIRTKAQEAVVRVFQETLRRIRADVLFRASCWREGKKLFIAGNQYNLSRFRKVLILGAGKATAAMAQALDEILQGIEVEGLVVTKYGHALPAGRISVFEAGHPLPDENSVVAGEKMLELAAAADPKDLVIVLISGGASALMEAPVEGVHVKDIELVTESLMKAGADIQQLNAVRSCLSRVKAGGLGRACGSAKVVCVLLSDVLGNSRVIVGSGPCWGAPPSGTEAMEILRRRRVPVQDSVASALRRVSSTEAIRPDHLVIGDVYTALEAAQKAAESLGLKPKVYGRPFTGEAREVGARMAAEAMALQGENGKYDCVIAAGETTVTVRGEGFGGRNQELACAAAIALEGVKDVALVAIGTDGTDGPTDAAGGIVDGETHSRANLRRALDENDSYHALEAADALITTGPTQTNLNDLVIIARVLED